MVILQYIVIANGVITLLLQQHCILVSQPSSHENSMNAALNDGAGLDNPTRRWNFIISILPAKVYDSVVIFGPQHGEDTTRTPKIKTSSALAITTCWYDPAGPAGLPSFFHQPSWSHVGKVLEAS